MENSLESIISEQPSGNGEAAATETQHTAETQEQHTGEASTTEGEQGTGEEAGAPPESQKKEDPLEKARKGLEAAAKAERERRQAAEQRAEAAERRARELELLHQRPAPKQPTQDADPKPTRADFQSEDEWLDARDAWRDRQREREVTEARQKQHEQELTTRSQRVLAEAQALPGFDMTKFVSTPISEPMFRAILASEVPGQLVHYLTANQEEALRIAQMPSQERQVMALARIEDKLAAQPAEEDDTPPKKEVQLPETLTKTRDARGRFEPAYSGPTPLNAILASK
jgi:hypothetical protein